MRSDQLINEIRLGNANEQARSTDGVEERPRLPTPLVIGPRGAGCLLLNETLSEGKQDMEIDVIDDLVAEGPVFEDLNRAGIGLFSASGRIGSEEFREFPRGGLGFAVQ